MSDYGAFENLASSDSEQRTASKQSQQRLAAAIYDSKDRYGDFIYAATALDEFHDRVALVKNDLMKTVNNHLPPVTGVMRRVTKALKDEWRQRCAADMRQAADAVNNSSVGNLDNAGQTQTNSGIANPNLPGHIDTTWNTTGTGPTPPGGWPQPGPDPSLGQRVVGKRASFQKGAPSSGNENDGRLHGPFAGYSSWEDCTSQNSDKGDPDAYCGRIYHQVEEGRKRKGEPLTNFQDKQSSVHYAWDDEDVWNWVKNKVPAATRSFLGPASQQGQQALNVVNTVATPASQMITGTPPKANAQQQGKPPSAGPNPPQAAPGTTQGAPSHEQAPHSSPYARNPAPAQSPGAGFSTSGDWSRNTTTKPVAPGSNYSVVGGDTLSDIATRSNTTVDSLTKANPSISNPNLITPGQQINIPKAGYRQADNTGPAMDLDQTYSPSDGPLIPEGDFKGYQDSVDQNAEGKVSDRFVDTESPVTRHDQDPAGPDFVKDSKVSLAQQVYVDWCAANRMRIASIDTLDKYAENLSDAQYFHLASAIHEAQGSGGKTNYLQKADEALTNVLNQKAEEFQEGIAALQQALQVIQMAEQQEAMANPMGVTPPAGTVDVLPPGPGGDMAGAGAGDVAGAMQVAQGLAGGGMGGGMPMGGGDPSQQMMARRHQLDKPGGTPDEDGKDDGTPKAKSTTKDWYRRDENQRFVSG